jgi:hypothetical protein
MTLRFHSLRFWAPEELEQGEVNERLMWAQGVADVFPAAGGGVDVRQVPVSGEC